MRFRKLIDTRYKANTQQGALNARGLHREWRENMYSMHRKTQYDIQHYCCNSSAAVPESTNSLSHLLVVAGKSRYLVVGDPNVVLDDATVPRAGAQDVSLPGKRSHARRVSRHRPQLDQAHTNTNTPNGLKRETLVTFMPPASRRSSSEADQGKTKTD